MPLPLGTITLLSERDDSLLTALDDQNGAPVALLPGTGGDNTQRWLVDNAGGAFTLRSAQAQSLFLAARSADPASPLILANNPSLGRWTVVEGDVGFNLQLADNPWQAAYSLLQIYPPRLALMDPNPDRTITWFASPVD
jgi:hypothetical protein